MIASGSELTFLYLRILFMRLIITVIILCFMAISCSVAEFGYFLDAKMDIKLSQPKWLGFSSGGDYLCLIGYYDIVILQRSNLKWNIIVQRELEDYFGGADLSPLEEVLVFGVGKNVNLFYLENLSERVIFKCRNNVSSICFSYGDYILVGDKGGWLYLLDWKRDSLIWECETNKGAIVGLGFGQLQETFFSIGNDDKAVMEWDLKTRKLLRTLQIEKARYGEVYTVAVTPFMGVFAVAGQSVYRPGGGLSAIGATFEEIIEIRDIEKGYELATLKGHLERINSLSFSPDGKYLASASDDHSIGIWSMEILREVSTIDTDYEMKGAAFCPTGRYLAGLDSKGSVFIWSLEGVSSSPIYTFSKVEYIPTLVSLPPFDGKRILVAVIPITSKGEVESNILQSCASIFSCDLLKTERFRLIERDRLDKVIEELKLGLSEVFTKPSESQRLGGLLQCEDLVFLEIYKMGDKLTISARIVDVGSGEIIVAEDEEYKGPVEHLSLATGVLARKLALDWDNLRKK